MYLFDFNLLNLKENISEKIKLIGIIILGIFYDNTQKFSV